MGDYAVVTLLALETSVTVPGYAQVGSGRHVMVGQNTLWGGAQDAHSSDGTVVMGSINSDVSFGSSGATNSFCSTQTALPAGWTVNTAWNGQSTLQTAWIDENSPAPTTAYLTAAWAAL